MRICPHCGRDIPSDRGFCPCSLRERALCEISPAHLARVLAAAGLSFQRTRSWKASPDPDYEAKAARLLSLYERAPAGGAVISFDQMGPLSLRPTHGSGWARRRPARHRATFNRRHGVRYGFGALDVHADRLRLRLMRRRRGQDTLALMRQIRLCYPRPIRLYGRMIVTGRGLAEMRLPTDSKAAPAVETIAEVGIPVLAVTGGWNPGFEAIADAVVAQTGGERAVLDTGRRFPQLHPDFNETLAAFLSNAERTKQQVQSIGSDGGPR
jgi:hypothetical protein